MELLKLPTTSISLPLPTDQNYTFKNADPANRTLSDRLPLQPESKQLLRSPTILSARAQLQRIPERSFIVQSLSQNSLENQEDNKGYWTLSSSRIPNDPYTFSDAMTLLQVESRKAPEEDIQRKTNPQPVTRIEPLPQPKINKWRFPVKPSIFSNLTNKPKQLPINKKTGTIMLSADSSPTHLYFAQKLLEYKESAKSNPLRKVVGGNQNHQFKKLKMIQNFRKRKSEEKSINFIKQYLMEQGEEDKGGWKLIYQSLFNPMSPEFKPMSNHIRDTKLWQDYLKNIKRKTEKDEFADGPLGKFKSMSCKNLLRAIPLKPVKRKSSQPEVIPLSMYESKTSRASFMQCQDREYFKLQEMKENYNSIRRSYHDYQKSLEKIIKSAPGSPKKEPLKPAPPPAKDKVSQIRPLLHKRYSSFSKSSITKNERAMPIARIVSGKAGHIKRKLFRDKRFSLDKPKLEKLGSNVRDEPSTRYSWKHIRYMKSRSWKSSASSNRISERGEGDVDEVNIFKINVNGDMKREFLQIE